MLRQRRQLAGRGPKHRVQPGAHLLVLEPVVDILPLPAVLDQPRIAQQPQLLRHIRLRLAQQRLQVADTLRVAPDGVQDAQPLRVRQQLQPVGQQFIVRFEGFNRKVKG